MNRRFCCTRALGALVVPLGLLLLLLGGGGLGGLARGDNSDLVEDAAVLDTRNVAVKQSIVKLHNTLRASVNPHAGNMLRMSIVKLHNALRTSVNPHAGNMLRMSIVKLHNALRASVNPHAGNMLRMSIVKLHNALRASVNPHAGNMLRMSIVKLHNALRASVNPHAGNMLRMEWNDEAGNNSYLWSLTCTLNHSPPANRKTSAFGCGENLFLSSAPFSWEHAIRDWFNEVDSPGFDYGKGARTPGAVGHYTQVVWYSSYQVGCAVTYCPDTESVYKYIYVCQYCPQGNLNTRLTRPYDLGEPCALCPNNCDNGQCTNPCPYVDGYSNCKQMKAAYGCGPSKNGLIVLGYCPASCRCADKIY